MLAQQMNVDNIAHNLANVNTTGFKKTRLEFQDLLYQTFKSAGAPIAAGTEGVPSDLEIGYGTRPVATQRIFAQGNAAPTNNPLDVMIDGNGFFQLLMPDGTVAYTRDGTFKISSEGKIVNSEGLTLQPEMTIPQDATDVSVGADGRVSVLLAGNRVPQDLGQIELARFINPGGLKSMGHNILSATVASGEPITGIPGETGMGRIAQGFLEMSNVEVVEEMVNLIVAQRAYEINSKAVQTADDMLSLTNNLRR
jgi:flagellar basal-body rod protein FlgG